MQRMLWLGLDKMIENGSSSASESIGMVLFHQIAAIFHCQPFFDYLMQSESDKKEFDETMRIYSKQEHLVHDCSFSKSDRRTFRSRECH